MSTTKPNKHSSRLQVATRNTIYHATGAPRNRAYYATWGGMAAAPAAGLLGSAGGAWALGLVGSGPVGGLRLASSARGQQLLRHLRLVKGTVG